MAKAETQGLGALTMAERNELQLLFGRLDKLPTTRLSTEARVELRRLAREDFEKAFPDLAKELRLRTGGRFDIHHRVPLDFAHLFPFKNINTIENLAAVEQSVHRGINKVWREYTHRVDTRVTAKEVEELAGIVERHFERWLGKRQYRSASDEQVGRAVEGALLDLQVLISRSNRGG
jgi:hypothetical protein